MKTEELDKPAGNLDIHKATRKKNLPSNKTITLESFQIILSNSLEVSFLSSLVSELHEYLA